MCLHCGSRSASRRQLSRDWADYLCSSCGGYRVDRFDQRCLPGPCAPVSVGRLVADVNGVRWLLP